MEIFEKLKINKYTVAVLTSSSLMKLNSIIAKLKEISPGNTQIGIQ